MAEQQKTTRNKKLLSQASNIFKSDNDTANEENNLDNLLDAKLIEDDDLLKDMIEDSPLLCNMGTEQSSTIIADRSSSIEKVAVAEREDFDDAVEKEESKGEEVKQPIAQDADIDLEVRLEGLEADQDEDEEIVLMMIDESPLLPEARAFQTDISEQDASTKTLLKKGTTPYSQTTDIEGLRAMQLAAEEEPLLIKAPDTAIETTN